MRIDVRALTSAINKIADLTNGDKTIPGVMLGIIVNDEASNDATLKVAYSDGHKSFVEYLACTREENDHIGDVVVDYPMLKRAIGQCQASGIISVDDAQFSYGQVGTTNVITISAQQYMAITGEDGEVVSKRPMANKRMDIAWNTPDANLKTSVLNRMKYESIFEPDGITDEYPREEFIDILQRTSVEKGKLTYVSGKAQSAFVANQAHLTVVPISRYEELSQEETDAIRGELEATGSFSAEAYTKAIADKVNRVHTSLVIPQNVAKALVGMLSKCSSENISVHTKDTKFCNIIVENDAEKIGIWFEMPTPSNIHLGTLKRYSSYEYKTYQVTFLREFLVNAVKSAIESAKNDTTKLKFEKTEIADATCDLDLVIDGKNAGGSISDVYRINPDDIVDAAGNLEGQTFSISLKVFSDMLAQLKTDMIAIDFNIDTQNNNVTCIRISEIITNKLIKEYRDARAKTRELCAQQGIEFDENTTPTAVELKLGYRDNILKTKQYTTLSNK